MNLPYDDMYRAPAPWASPTKAVQPFLVFSPGGNAPKFQHSTRAAAETEARRLSALNPGQLFYVLGSLSYTLAHKPTPQPKPAPKTVSLV